jgi:hypothetical protein
MDSGPVTRTRFGKRDENQTARFSQAAPRVQGPGTGQLCDGRNALHDHHSRRPGMACHPYCQSSAPVKHFAALFVGISEQMRVGVFSNRDSRGMFHPPLCGDRVELASAVFHLRDHSQVVVL